MKVRKSFSGCDDFVLSQIIPNFGIVITSFHYDLLSSSYLLIYHFHFYIDDMHIQRDRRMLPLSEGLSTNLNRSANTESGFAIIVNSSLFSSFNRIRIYICCWLCFYSFFLVTVKFTNATVNNPVTIAPDIFQP